MAEGNGSGRTEDEDDELAAILAESRDSYLNEQYSILKSIQEEMTMAKEGPRNEADHDFWKNSGGWDQNQDYDATAASWNQCSSSSLDDDDDWEGRRGERRRMPRKSESRSSQDPWCSTSTIHTSPTAATEFSDADVIQEQIRILQEIQAQAAVTRGSRPARHESSSSYEDQTRQLADGSHVYVKGMKEAYASIANGDAILTPCAVCGTISQVPSRTRNLYCTQCQQISPVRRQDDAALARSIQCREKECQQKMEGSLNR